MFQWASKAGPEPRPPSFSFVIADYNPTVLQLVTLPNFILTWALSQGASTPELHEACTGDDEQGHELELTPEVLEAFQRFLAEAKISLSFLSGAWSPEFVDLIYSSATSSDTDNNAPAAPTTVVLGAETIYSPFALKSFSETVFAILERERRAFGVRPALAYVGAKRLYFGVGGSLDDFIEDAQAKGAVVNQLREETQGVRRGVVCCSLGGDQSAAG
jgi:protein-histidine N-methyltransferase